MSLWWSTMLQEARASNKMADAKHGMRRASGGTDATAERWYQAGADKTWSTGKAGASVDVVAGFNLYMQAAKRGHSAAKNEVGYGYEYGLGVDKDTDRAYTYYKAAADDGQVDALANTARCLHNGIGVRRDMQQAARMYRQHGKALLRQAAGKRVTVAFKHAMTELLDAFVTLCEPDSSESEESVGDEDLP